MSIQSDTEVKIIDEHGIDEETGLISPIRSTTLLSKGKDKKKTKKYGFNKVEKVEIEPQNQYPEECAAVVSSKPAARLPKVSGLMRFHIFCSHCSLAIFSICVRVRLCV